MLDGNKEYLTVYADYSAEGDITPVSITFDNGQKVKVSRVISSIPMSTTKKGGAEIRYTVILRGQLGYLFLEPGKNPKWYIKREFDL